MTFAQLRVVGIGAGATQRIDVLIDGEVVAQLPASSATFRMLPDMPPMLTVDVPHPYAQVHVGERP